MSCFVLSPLQALIVFSSSWLAALVSHDHTLLFIGEHTVLQVCSSCLRAYYPEKAALYPFGASHFCKPFKTFEELREAHLHRIEMTTFTGALPHDLTSDHVIARR